MLTISVKTLKNEKKLFFHSFTVALFALFVLPSCDTAKSSYESSDKTAQDIIEQTTEKALGESEHISISPYENNLRTKLIKTQNLKVKSLSRTSSTSLDKPEHWNSELNLTQKVSDELEDKDLLNLTFEDSLQIAAAYNRSYQQKKESIFRASLDLDLQQDAFRNTYSGLLSSFIDSNQAVGDVSTGVTNSFTPSVTRRLKNGAQLAGKLAFDVSRLFSTEKASATGILFDTSISIPLLSGSGKHIVTENLTQAERNLIYEIWEFERQKRSLAVSIASSFLSTLQLEDRLNNAAANYQRAILSAKRAKRMSEAGRLPDNQVSQAKQRELESRQNWVRAEEQYLRALDAFKLTLGLPTDCRLDPDRSILQNLNEKYTKDLLPDDDQSITYTEKEGKINLIKPDREGGGPLELEEDKALTIALNKRLDLLVSESRVEDSQRQIIIARDRLDPELNLAGSYKAGARRTLGSVQSENVGLDLRHGSASGGLVFEMPWERTADSHRFRESYINLENTLRGYQALEDQIKLEIRNSLRSLIQNRTSILIQQNALKLAYRRVDSTNLFLEAGRIAIRDVLEAQDDLVAAQDRLTNAIVSYRLSELAMQRDMGVLEVTKRGILKEYYEQKK
ncbi:MAG: TolC family protein [Lentisphaeraceae bacterium]|nr:TolC family protein [Lentisphaeraceae bacterium]